MIPMILFQRFLLLEEADRVPVALAHLLPVQARDGRTFGRMLASGTFENLAKVGSSSPQGHASPLRAASGPARQARCRCHRSGCRQPSDGISEEPVRRRFSLRERDPCTRGSSRASASVSCSSRSQESSATCGHRSGERAPPFPDRVRTPGNRGPRRANIPASPWGRAPSSAHDNPR